MAGGPRSTGLDHTEVSFRSIYSSKRTVAKNGCGYKPPARSSAPLGIGHCFVTVSTHRRQVNNSKTVKFGVQSKVPVCRNDQQLSRPRPSQLGSCISTSDLS